MRIQSQILGNERAVRFQMAEKKYCYPTHIHQYAELAIVLHGDVALTVDGKKEELHPGDAAFIFPFQTHEYHSECFNRIGLFIFSPSMIPDFFKVTATKVGKSASFTPNEEIINMFKERIISKNDISLYDIKGCIYLFLSDYLNSTELKESSVESNIAVNVVNYVNQHISEKITLEALAEEMNYNPNYVSSCIQRLFGINLCTLVASIRTDKAKYLLWETDKTGLEICFECGFGSERSFHRQFKAITGTTPKEYRTSIKKRLVNYGIIKYFD